MATKKAVKNTQSGIEKIKSLTEKINAQALQFSDNFVEETLATGGQWQKVFSKALKNGTEVLEQQQDLTFDTLESIKGHVLKGNYRLRKLFQIEKPKDAKPSRKGATKSQSKTAKPKSKNQTITTKSDLKAIEGIGPKLESILNEAGILNFEHLAKAKVSKLESILESAGPRYKMHKPATWAQQAQLAAAGKTEELKALQAELKGGKVVK